jgi:hypothetical protein
MSEDVTEVEVPRTPGVHLVLSDEDMETLGMLLEDAWRYRLARLARYGTADRALFERYRAFAAAHGLGDR